jgi:hypothetical protein
MVQDAHAGVVWALDAIGVRDRPDLWCLEYTNDYVDAPNRAFPDRFPASTTNT